MDLPGIVILITFGEAKDVFLFQWLRKGTSGGSKL